MTDAIQKTLTALDEAKMDRFNAISSLVGVIEEAYPGQFKAEDLKELQAFVGQIVADVESRCIDIYTAVTSIDEARSLAAAGVPAFLDLIAIGAE
ncbi:hypothetical protein [Asticcacaulis sp.]|uniref:hypothetical protein n=1 Tax=Asticcacaulis sp. TaxID=1872648 RepID=UPI003F7BC62E